MSTAPAFHYDDAAHAYTLNGRPVLSITQLIEKGGLVSGLEFFTEASRQRGTEIHRLCTLFDLGALDLAALNSPYAPYVLAYIEACQQLKPELIEIEEAVYHPDYRLAGRPDRVWRVMNLQTVAEIKSAAKAKHHAIQTALQAIVLSAHHPLPPEQWQRLVIYVKKTGRFSVERHDDPRDFHTAYGLIKEFCV